MSYRKLLRVIGGEDLEKNLNRIAQSMSKTAWLSPDLTNIFSHGDAYEYPVTVNDVTGTYKINSIGTSISTIVAGTTAGVDFKVKPLGQVKLLAATSAKAIFGDATDVTNCMLMMIELPTLSYTSVKAALDSEAAAALTEDNVILGEDVCYYAYPIGLYDSSGTTTSANAKITLSYNGKNVKYEFDLSGVTLQTGS